MLMKYFLSNSNLNVLLIIYVLCIMIYLKKESQKSPGSQGTQSVQKQIFNK